ncbi:MAG: hypothetical protein QGG36_30600 [Pirellulaceae bacterium]|jgi:hypothetical protein|nr:hypothetical protein [Pirellulaceae bacterium]
MERAIDDPEPSEIPDPAIEFPLEIVPEAPGVAVESGWSPDGSEDQAAPCEVEAMARGDARVERGGAG